MLGGDFVDVIPKKKIIGNSKKVTLGDPRDISNRRSARILNTQTKPQRYDPDISARSY